jgi:putative membrane protein
MMSNGMMGGGMGLWMAIAAIFWILLAVGVVLLTVWGIQRFRTGPGHKTEESALDILKKRYARGEISREEYEEKKRDIS